MRKNSPADEGEAARLMSHQHHLGWIVVLAMAWSAPAARGQCRIERLPAIPVTMRGLRPMVWAKINGVRARFIIDTGAFWSMLSPAAEAEYHLPERAAPWGFWLEGINGPAGVDIATADTFTFLKVRFHHADFLVGGNDFASGAVGLLGGNVLRVADMEYDFGDGLMRVVKARHCGDLPLAYWAGNQPIGEVDLSRTSARRPELLGHAYLNGRKIRVLFDTGSPQSMLALETARRAGITPSSPGVKPAGKISGIGRKLSKSWIAPVALFEIGGEKIEHTRVLIADIHRQDLGADMLLGADFFLSHHVYVANRRHKLYFTYNGGPVFDLGQRYWIKRAGATPVLAGTPASTGGAAGATAARGAAGTRKPGSAGPADPGKLMRQGMAYASEGQYAPALADLTRACRLRPENPRYLLQRGKVYRQDKQPARALADFDAAITLQPNLYQAHMARASLLLAWKHAPADARAEARSDANIVELLAPDPSQLRLSLAYLFARMGQYATAIREVSLWIHYHREDVLLPSAWSARCWFRAAADVDLAKALEDCDRAREHRPDSADILDSRGLIYLRQGKLDRSIEDYDQALRIDSGMATSLYGRGLAELRQGKTALGRSDLTAARRMYPGVAALFARMGLKQ